MSLEAKVRAAVRDIPDFPKPGILFKDIMPVLADGGLFEEVTEHFAARLEGRGVELVVGIESRGFLFGTPLAHALGVGFAPLRKPGKLPFDHVGVDYELEYGTDRLEIHSDVLEEGMKVVLIDDLLATGGTAAAGVELITGQGAEIVELQFLIELGFLGGAAKLGDQARYAMIEY